MKSRAKIPLSKPALSETDINAAVEILRSGRLISGPVVEDFEGRLAAHSKVHHAVCVSSGTAALHLGLLALGIRSGDDIIVPAFGYPAAANAVEMVGARPVFVDSEPDGFNIDTSRIENHITFRTRAIIVVHNFGFPVDTSTIQTLSAKYDIPIIEDAACALGATIDGTNCGGLGRLAAFSFHPRKILTTGEGGTVVTDDYEIADKIRKLRNLGQNYENGAEFEMPGLNYRMTEFQAALGISQLGRLDEIMQRRSQAACYYIDNLKGIGYLKTFDQNDIVKPNFQTFVVSVPPDVRDSVIVHLKSRDIESGMGIYSVPHTGYYARKYKFGESRFPESLKAFRSLLSLPLYDGITRAEQDRVIESLRSLEKSMTNQLAMQAVNPA